MTCYQFYATIGRIMNKFYKQVEVKNNKPSIRYDAEEDAYYISSWGKPLGKFHTDLDNYMKILNNDIESFNNEYGISNAKYSTDAETKLGQLNSSNQYLVSVNDMTPVNDLPFGAFVITIVDHGIKIKPFKLSVEDIKTVRNHNLEIIVNDFFTKASINRKHKQGILLYGSPGQGKTLELHKLVRDAANSKRRIFFVDDSIKLKNISGFRTILENDESIFILEEITERMTRNGVEDILTFLDGEHSWKNSITIATTNHPEKLPSNIVDRPGRFSKFIEYKSPTNEDIKNLAELFNYNDDDYTFLFDKNLSFDYCSYILDMAIKDGKKIEDTYTQEKEYRKKLSETFKGKLGIS